MRPCLVPSLLGKRKVMVFNHHGWIGDRGLGNTREAAQDLTHLPSK